MVKHFFCCLSLKTGAILMAFINLMGGAGMTIGAIVELCNTNDEGTITLFILLIIVGIASIFNGVLVLIGMIQAKEKYILLYLLTSSAALFIVTIYSGINMFEYKLLSIVCLFSVIMWYGQIAMYHYYEEVCEYNTVNAGVIEIAYNINGQSYVNTFPVKEESFENTAV